jgi:hypothetical protein
MAVYPHCQKGLEGKWYVQKQLDRSEVLEGGGDA